MATAESKLEGVGGEYRESSEQGIEENAPTSPEQQLNKEYLWGYREKRDRLESLIENDFPGTHIIIDSAFLEAVLRDPSLVNVLDTVYEFLSSNKSTLAGRLNSYDITFNPESAFVDLKYKTLEIGGHVSIDYLDHYFGITEVSLELQEKSVDVEKENLKFGKQVINGIEIWTTEFAAKNSTEEELDTIIAEIDGAIYDLKENERELLRSNNISIIIKGPGTLESIFQKRTGIIEVGMNETGSGLINYIRAEVIPNFNKSDEKLVEAEKVVSLPVPAETEEATSELLSKSDLDGTDTEQHKELPSISPESKETGVPSTDDVKDIILSEHETEENKKEDEEEMEEWTDLERARFEYVHRLEQSRKNAKGVETALNLSLEEAEAKYYAELENEKNKINQEVYKAHGWTEGDRVPAGDTEVLKVEIKRRIFDELVVGEHDKRMGEIEEHRKVEGGSEKYKVYLQQGWRWYIGLSKPKRFLVSVALGTSVGYLVGMTGSAGVVSYGIHRALRVGTSIVSSAAGAAVGQKLWSIEETKKKEEEAKEKLKQSYSEEDIKGATEKYTEIDKKAAEEKKSKAIKKTILAVGAGGIGGFLAGSYEGGYSRGSTNSVLENKGGKTSVVDNSARVKAPEVEPVKVGKEAQVPKTEEVTGAPESKSPSVAQQVVKQQVPEASKIFSDPSILKVETPPGGSHWNNLKDILEHNDKFKNANQAKQTYILSSLSNEFMEDPTKYGGRAGGELYATDKIDYSKLFENPEKINTLLDKNLSVSQEKSIIENNLKIKSWIESHPDEKIDSSKITEILSQPKASKIVIEDAPPIHAEINQESVAGNTAPVKPDSFEDHITLVENAENAENAKSIPSGAELHDQIAEARGNPPENQTSSLPEKRSMMGDFLDYQEVNAAFKADVDSIYGEKRLFGLSSIEGVDTLNWKSIKDMKAKDFMEFFTHDSAESNLNPHVKDVLTKLPKHRNMFAHMSELIKYAGGNVKPYENENMENFVKRLGGHIMKNHGDLVSSQQFPKAT